MAVTIKSPAGTQIQRSSLRRTEEPRLLKNRPIPIGETRLADSGKHQRVRAPTVPPEVTVSDTEPESDNIEVRNRRTHCANHPDTFWDTGLVKESSESKSGHSMCGQ